MSNVHPIRPKERAPRCPLCTAMEVIAQLAEGADAEVRQTKAVIEARMTAGACIAAYLCVHTIDGDHICDRCSTAIHATAKNAAHVYPEIGDCF